MPKFLMIGASRGASTVTEEWSSGTLVGETGHYYMLEAKDSSSQFVDQVQEILGKEGKDLTPDLMSELRWCCSAFMPDARHLSMQFAQFLADHLDWSVYSICADLDREEPENFSWLRVVHT